ncbi:MAG: hypothetical protein ACRC6R_02705 [Bacteroidales bacterium]
MSNNNIVTCSIAKFEDGVISEDAVMGMESMIAVSDGAGGGGIYAERWSKYLVERLPFNPLRSFEEMDEWIASIWEPFYNECEEDAKVLGGMLLDKFYDEGSFATLAVAWRNSPSSCCWMSYGDSVVFHYDAEERKLEHSFSSLADFSSAPYLINSKDELSKDGFRSGEFKLGAESTVFVATDALAHYLLMMYELSQGDVFEQEWQSILYGHTRQCQLLQSAKAIKGPIYFHDKVLKKLINSAKLEHDFKHHLSALKKKGVLAHDDYSFAAMW